MPPRSRIGDQFAARFAARGTTTFPLGESIVDTRNIRGSGGRHVGRILRSGTTAAVGVTTGNPALAARGIRGLVAEEDPNFGFDSLVGNASTEGGCPGLTQVRNPFGEGCIELTDLVPGGDPALVGEVPTGTPRAPGGNGVGSFEGFGAPVRGFYGVGITPRVDVQTVRRCPGGFALGDDGVCYDNLPRNSPRRAHPLGMKPLLTAGDRAAIRKARSAATKLASAKKSLAKTARALAKIS